jgi:hypothetical protein
VWAVAEERSRLDQSEQTPKEPPDQAEEEPVITATQLLAGAAIPIRLNLHYELTTGRPEGIDEVVPESVLDKISDSQDRLLRWLQRDHENRVQFLIDPLAALGKVGIDLEPEERDALLAVHERNASSEILPPGVEVGSVSVDLVQTGTEGPPHGDEPAARGSETEGG